MFSFHNIRGIIIIVCNMIFANAKNRLTIFVIALYLCSGTSVYLFQSACTALYFSAKKKSKSFSDARVPNLKDGKNRVILLYAFSNLSSDNF